MLQQSEDHQLNGDWSGQHSIIGNKPYRTDCYPNAWKHKIHSLHQLLCVRRWAKPGPEFFEVYGGKDRLPVQFNAHQPFSDTNQCMFFKVNVERLRPSCLDPWNIALCWKTLVLWYDAVASLCTEAGAFDRQVWPPSRSYMISLYIYKETKASSLTGRDPWPTRTHWAFVQWVDTTHTRLELPTGIGLCPKLKYV